MLQCSDRKKNLEMDLVSGFGYRGSVGPNVVYATFTFIFFALEGSMMGQSLQLSLGIPLWIGYAASTIIVRKILSFVFHMCCTGFTSRDVWDESIVKAPNLHLPNVAGIDGCSSHIRRCVGRNGCPFICQISRG